MAGKRKRDEQDLASAEPEELSDDEFDFDDSAADGDDDVFTMGDSSSEMMLDDEPDEDELDELEDDDFASESARIDTASLADDPVRMYLKEIGQVPLLDTNREMWLSTQLAAERTLQELTDRLSSLENSNETAGLPREIDIVELAYDTVLTNWQAVIEQATSYGAEVPDLRAIIDEVQLVSDNWDVNGDSYVRKYLRQQEWGRDELWTELARSVFNVIHALYLIPFNEQMEIRKYYRENQKNHRSAS